MTTISNDTMRKIRELAKAQAENIAKEFEDKMTEKYDELLDRYYGEPYQTRPPHYGRTNNLRNSYRTFTFVSPKQVSGNFIVDGTNMKDYKQPITGEGYVAGYYFNPAGTWHGGDWHGGYGVKAGFNAYNEMVDYYKGLAKGLRNKYEN